MLENIIKNAENQNPICEGDYKGEDGLIYCGKCHTPKQFKVTISSKEQAMPISCKCEQEKDEQEKAKFEKIKLENRIKENRFNAFSDNFSQNITFEKDNKPNTDISKLSRNYVKSFDTNTSKSLVFYGGCGMGKSFYAVCICNALIDKGFKVKFTSVREISNKLWNCTNKEEIYRQIAGYDLLVLDDLYAERNSDYMNEIIFNVIDERYRNRKPMIITTNLSADEIGNSKELSKYRIFDRLFEMALLIQIKGEDNRKRMLKENMQAEINKLLNS